MPTTEALRGIGDRELISVACWLFANARPSSSVLERVGPVVAIGAVGAFAMATRDNDKTRRGVAEALSAVVRLASTQPLVLFEHADVRIPIRVALRQLASNSSDLRRRAIAALGAITAALRCDLPRGGKEFDELDEAVALAVVDEFATPVPDKLAKALLAGMGPGANAPKTYFEALGAQMGNVTRHLRDGNLNAVDAAWLMAVLSVVPALVGGRFCWLERTGPKTWVTAMLDIQATLGKVSSGLRCLVELGLAHFIYAFVREAATKEGMPATESNPSPAWLVIPSVIEAVQQFADVTAEKSAWVNRASGDVEVKGRSSRSILRTLCYAYSHYGSRTDANVVVRIVGGSEPVDAAPGDLAFDRIVQPRFAAILGAGAVKDVVQAELWSLLQGMFGADDGVRWTADRLIHPTLLRLGSDGRTDMARVIEASLAEPAIRCEDMPTWTAMWRLTRSARLFALLRLVIAALPKLSSPVVLLPPTVEATIRGFLADAHAAYLVDTAVHAPSFATLLEGLVDLAQAVMDQSPTMALQILAIGREAFSDAPRDVKALDELVTRMDVSAVRPDDVAGQTDAPAIWSVIGTSADLCAH